MIQTRRTKLRLRSVVIAGLLIAAARVPAEDWLRWGVSNGPGQLLCAVRRNGNVISAFGAISVTIGNTQPAERNNDAEPAAADDVVWTSRLDVPEGRGRSS